MARTETVTVAFTDLVGSTELQAFHRAQVLEAEEAGAILHHLLGNPLARLSAVWSRARRE